ncbi:beta-galactosidase [Paenibacillus sp. UNCCL117]|uniref:beta-galactosidase n=1 Tax=unclassified Paenibacillus TaxID=185978 RepID=UPI00088EA901|nr:MULTISPECIES: beta-galactosidase [unclassified Paenibacillus]SDD66014.1 beta-galactosidase [Paenibacillus sp. cl123]SFW58014.1 beta-galactosidase [Paenibacillus sp. UNCCL117]
MTAGRRYPPVSAKLPALMHGADYNPDQWLDSPEVLGEDIRLMKLANTNVMAVGIFAWSAIEPEEGVFTFDWLDQTLDRLAAGGIYAWLSTPSGARPAWMSERYPEVLRVGGNRVRNLHGLRHNHCLTSPVYREKVRTINAKLAERYAAHPAVIGWHISNEYGGECHCPLCQDAFRAWLKRTYKTLDELNQAWWTTFWSHTFTSWSQIESPAPHGEYRLHGLNLAWRRFVSDQSADFCRNEILPIKAVDPQATVTSNLTLWNDWIDYRPFADLLDVVSWDAYPEWHKADNEGEAAVAAFFSFNHDLFRSLKGGQPFVLMECAPSSTNWQPVSKLKRPGMHKLSALHAVAHGADSIQYFQWRKSRGSFEKFHGAVVDHVGTEHTRVFREVAELGETLERLREVAGTTAPARVAVIADWDNRWAVKDAQGPRNMGLHYEETVVQHYRAFWELGIPVDIIDRHSDLSRYALVVAPMMYMADAASGERIEAYVRGGGTFVATYWSGIVNEHDLCHLGGFPGPLRTTLGIWSEEIDGLYDGVRNALSCVDGNSLGLSGEYAAHELCDLIHLEGAQALAVYRDDFYAGRPALTVHHLGQGRAYYLAARATEPFYAPFYAAVCEQAGIERVVATELPAGVTAQLRSDGTFDYVFLLNFSSSEQRVSLDERRYTDMESGETLDAGELVLPLYGARVLKRAAR